jgi:hypothetical protein
MGCIAELGRWIVLEYVLMEELGVRRYYGCKTEPIVSKKGTVALWNRKI